MIKFKEVKGLTLENTENLQKIIRTEDGRAIGHIPGWKCLIDPDYIDGSLIRNRCIAGSKFQASRDATVITKGDNNLFDLTQSAFRVNCDEKTKINPIEYTIFAVLNVAESTSARPLWVLRGNTTNSTTDVGNAPNFSISSNGGQCSVFSKIIDGSYDQHVSSGLRIATFPLNRNLKSTQGLSLLVLSYSQSEGFTASQDGVVLGNVRVLADLLNDLDDFSYFREIRGIAGMCGIFDIDLHKSENIAYRKQLEAHLMKKYAI